MGLFLPSNLRMWRGMSLGLVLALVPVLGKSEEAKEELLVSDGVHHFAQDQSSMLILKGNDVKGVISGHSDGKFEIKSQHANGQQANVFRSRNGKAIVIDGQAATTYSIKVPLDVRIFVSGGKVDLRIDHIKSNVTVDGGIVKLRGKASFQDVKVTAAVLDLQLEGVERDLSIFCSEAKVEVVHSLLPMAQKKGITLRHPPTATLHFAIGKVTLIFPKACQLFYPRNIPGLHAQGEARYKGCDGRIFVYIPPEGAEVFLEKR